MAKKSNKTSHVLSLIANKPEPPESVEVEPPIESSIQEETQEHPLIESKSMQENSVSELIREELEKTSKEDIMEMEEIEEMETAMSPQPEVQELNFDNFEEELEETLVGNSENAADWPGEAPKYFNIVEGLVRNKLATTMRRLGMCTCEKCLNDVTALALNMLPPCYVVSDTGKLYAKLNSYEKQYAADLLSAIAKSCLQIKKNPRH